VKTLFHGGVAGLAIADLLEPGHTRDNRHPGCPVCEARARGETYRVGGRSMDPPSSRPDRVYLTTERLYALFHASLYGRGDLYIAEPIGAVDPSTEDPFPAFYAESARVIAVPQRAVVLRQSERRKLYLAWGKSEGRSKRVASEEFERLIDGTLEAFGR